MNSSIPILLVEDDVLDIKNVQRAFKESRILNPLFVVRNGEEALAYLRREPPFDAPDAAPRPGIILLDLNMPKMGGLEFLAAYKKVQAIRPIPTVILTTSDEERDRINAYDIGIAGYIVKPVDFAKFIDAVMRFGLYWTLCEVP